MKEHCHQIWLASQKRIFAEYFKMTLSLRDLNRYSNRVIYSAVGSVSLNSDKQHL